MSAEACRRSAACSSPSAVSSPGRGRALAAGPTSVRNPRSKLMMSRSISSMMCRGSGRLGKQTFELCAGVVSAHECFAHEKSADALFAQPLNVFWLGYSAFGHDEALGRDPLEQIERRLQMRFERT